MKIDAPNTKTVLVLAAGELFAEHGFDGVSTRMIAEKAGVNLGGIHYHFGTKEALYVAAFKYVCEQDKRPNIAGILRERPDLGETPEGMAEAILIGCRNFLSHIFDSETPEWRSRLVIRELTNPSSALPILVKEVFQEELTGDIALYRKLHPEASEEEATVWATTLKAQGVFHMLARLPLEMRLGKPLGKEYLDHLIRITARSMILAAGLPLPAEITGVSPCRND